MSTPAATEPALSVRELHTYFDQTAPVVRAVDGMSFDIEQGECLAVVGESGSGKTMTALSLVRLLPPGARIVSGGVSMAGTDLTALRESEMRKWRARRIAIMFQDPMTCLNPAMRIDRQLVETLVAGRMTDRATALAHGRDLLERTGIPDVDGVLRSYPHQLSGGMRQRVIFAMSLMCEPEVLIADEPTTAVDVTTQEQILDLIETFKRDWGLAVLLITHDLGAVARIADKVLVMYAGRPAEYGTADSVFENPMHPYTRGLINSVDLGRYAPRSRLDTIEGTPPALDAIPAGCAFHPRCPYKIDVCSRVRPELTTMNEGGQSAACHVAAAGDLPRWSRKSREAP